MAKTLKTFDTKFVENSWMLQQQITGNCENVEVKLRYVNQSKAPLFKEYDQNKKFNVLQLASIIWFYSLRFRILIVKLPGSHVLHNFRELRKLM